MALRTCPCRWQLFFPVGEDGGKGKKEITCWIGNRNGIFYQHVSDVSTLYTMHIMLYGICMSFCIHVSMCVSIMFCVRCLCMCDLVIALFI